MLNGRLRGRLDATTLLQLGLSDLVDTCGLAASLIEKFVLKQVLQVGRQINESYAFDEAFSEAATLNCIFRSVPRKTPAQHSFAPQTCR